jgi:hypothetical protein
MGGTPSATTFAGTGKVASCARGAGDSRRRRAARHSLERIGTPQIVEN